MRLTLSAILCLLFLNTTFAQQFHVSLTEPTQTDFGFSSLAAPNGGYIGIDRTAKNVSGLNWNRFRFTVTARLYDKDMKMIKESKLSNGDNVYSGFYSAFKKIGDTYWLIYVEPAEKSNIGNVMAVSIDPATLATGTPKLLAAAGSMELSLPMVDGMSKLTFQFVTSPDQKHSMLLVGASKEQFYLARLDEQLNVVWGRKETIAGITDHNIHSSVIDNNGNIYLSYTEYIKNAPNMGHIMIFKKTGAPVNKTVSINGTLKEVKLLAAKKGDLIYVAGTFFEETENLAGAYKASMSTTDFKLSTITRSAFTDSLVERFSKDSWGNKKPKKYGLYPQFTAELIESGDGIVNLVAEFKTQVSGTRAVFYISGSILVVSFGNTATTFARIPKSRTSAGSTIGDSYAVFSSQGKLILFYNDVEKNLNRDINLDPAGSDVYLNAMLVAAVIDHDGIVKREKVIDLRQKDFLAIGDRMNIVAPAVLQFPVYKIKNLGGVGNEMMTATVTID